MKSTLIRIFTIMTLATSLSAFAMSEKAKDAGTNKTHSDETTACAPADQNSDNRSDNGDSKSQKIEQQDRQWLHDLQGIYGG